MKYKVVIKSHGEVWGDSFREVDQEGHDKIQSDALAGKWGRQARWEIDSPLNPVSDEDKAKATIVEDVELEPAIPEQTITEEPLPIELEGAKVNGLIIAAKPAVMGKRYFLPAEYEIIVEDITAQHEAELATKEAEKVKKEKNKTDAENLMTWVKTTNKITDELRTIIIYLMGK